MMIVAVVNGTIPTLSGRRIPAPPRLRTDSTRKFRNDERKLARWLVDHARAEARARGDGWNLFGFERMADDPKRMSWSDWDIANDYLFGETEIGCVVEQLAQPRLPLAEQAPPVVEQMTMEDVTE